MQVSNDKNFNRVCGTYLDFIQFFVTASPQGSMEIKKQTYKFFFVDLRIFIASYESSENSVQNGQNDHECEFKKIKGQKD